MPWSIRRRPGESLGPGILDAGLRSTCSFRAEFVLMMLPYATPTLGRALSFSAPGLGAAFPARGRLHHTDRPLRRRRIQDPPAEKPPARRGADLDHRDLQPADGAALFCQGHGRVLSDRPRA